MTKSVDFCLKADSTFQYFAFDYITIAANSAAFYDGKHCNIGNIVIKFVSNDEVPYPGKGYSTLNIGVPAGVGYISTL